MLSFQSEGKLHGDDGEGASGGGLAATGGGGLPPVPAVRAGKLQDHE